MDEQTKSDSEKLNTWKQDGQTDLEKKTEKVTLKVRSISSPFGYCLGPHERSHAVVDVGYKGCTKRNRCAPPQACVYVSYYIIPFMLCSEDGKTGRRRREQHTHSVVFR